MNQLLHAMAIDKNAKPQHMRVLMYVIANGPGADLYGIPFSPQAIDSAADHLVFKGIITRDSGRSTFSLANSDATPEQIAPVVTPPPEPVSDDPKTVDERHPFLKRTWEFEQKPALQAWRRTDTMVELCGIALLACHEPERASAHKDYKEALNRAEQWAVREVEDQDEPDSGIDHPFLDRSWELEQMPALKAWRKKGLSVDLCRLARFACVDPVKAAGHPDLKKALDIASRFLRKVELDAFNEESA